MPFEGLITACVTPIKDGTLDESCLRENISFQLKSGVQGLLFCGSTGEGMLLSKQEQERILSIAVEEVQEKVPILISTTEMTAQKVIEKIKWADALGVDGALIAPPPYIRPTQEGLLEHFQTIAQESTLPIILYNHPGRIGIEFELETLLELAEQETIVGLKDVSGNLSLIEDLIVFESHLTLLSGEDRFAFPAITLGANGLISIMSNLVPKSCVDLVAYALAGDMEQARHIHYALLPLLHACELATNPIPIKAMMHRLGMTTGECRSPLTPLDEEDQEVIKDLLLELQEDISERV